MIHSFEWYQIVPGMKLLPGQVAHALIVACILIALAVLCNRRIAAKGCDTVPDRRLSPLSFFELVYNGFLGIMRENLGDHARDFVPLIGGLGTFILFSNLIGLIPGFTPPTDNINTTAACAIIVFLATHYYGFRAHGIGYLKQFVGPFWWLAWLMIPIEIISHLARPLSLSLRLFGNLMGDHIVFTMFVSMSVGLTQFIVKGSPVAMPFAVLSPFIPLVVMLLGIFVAIVQTFVFTLLSTTYIAGAVSDHH